MSAGPPPTAPLPRTVLAGWGGNTRAVCFQTTPRTTAEVIDHLDPAGTIARGLGRSYGDCATNAGRRVVGMTELAGCLEFSEQTGLLTCEAGVSLSALIDAFAPRGWFPSITPGTRFVTVGGCIANDVHGKAHHAQGTFSSCVERMTVLLASGEVVEASRTERPDLFWATFGGMGLLGIVLTATIRLRRVETTWFKQRSIRVGDLAEMLAALEENDRDHPYSVATLDVFAKGSRLGRGVVTVGDAMPLAELPERLRSEALRVAAPPRLSVPFELPDWFLNPASMRIVNAVIQLIQATAPAVGHYDGFFYPLDKIGHWNRGYGRRGFTQYQFVIPFEDGARNMRQILATILDAGELPFLNVLKRFGKASEGILSFPREGYTFAIDFPIRPGTRPLLQRLDKMVLEAGGRVYLGKDSFLDAATFRAMYPQVDRWREVRDRYDPNGLFTSDLGRRVGLVDPG